MSAFDQHMAAIGIGAAAAAAAGQQAIVGIGEFGGGGAAAMGRQSSQISHEEGMALAYGQHQRRMRRDECLLRAASGVDVFSRVGNVPIGIPIPIQAMGSFVGKPVPKIVVEAVVHMTQSQDWIPECLARSDKLVLDIKEVTCSECLDKILDLDVDLME